MNFNAAYKIFLGLLLFFTFQANAQQSVVSAGSGTISGKLIDASNNQTLPFATVALIRKSDSKLLKGLQTDMNGNFKLADIADGIYTVRITFVCYLTISKDINISANNRTINLGNLKMGPAKGLLKEVVINSGKKIKYRNKGNPAVELIRKVIAHKKQNRLENNN